MTAIVLLLFRFFLRGSGGSLRSLSFFRRFASPLDALGAGFSALRKHLSSDQFQHGGVGAVTFSPSCMDDAGVSAVPRGVTRGDFLKEFFHRDCAQAVSGSQPARVQITALAQTDHFFRKPPRRLGLGPVVSMRSSRMREVTKLRSKARRWEVLRL